LGYALEIDPRPADAWAFRGHVWGAKGDFARAIADYDQALKLRPRWSDVYVNRGIARLMQGKLAEAEADFARCRALGGSLTPEAERLLQDLKRR
jgi:Tfp pilus assembly protein PilF